LWSTEDLLLLLLPGYLLCLLERRYERKGREEGKKKEWGRKGGRRGGKANRGKEREE